MLSNILRQYLRGSISFSDDQQEGLRSFVQILRERNKVRIAMRIQYTHSSAAVIPHCCVPGTTGTVTKSMKRKTSPSPFAKIEGMWVVSFFLPPRPKRPPGCLRTCKYPCRRRGHQSPAFISPQAAGSRSAHLVPHERRALGVFLSSHASNN